MLLTAYLEMFHGRKVLNCLLRGCKYNYKTCFVCVKETSSCDVSFIQTEHMFDRKKTLIIIIFGGYIPLCLSPYKSNYERFEMKH